MRVALACLVLLLAGCTSPPAEQQPPPSETAPEAPEAPFVVRQSGSYAGFVHVATTPVAGSVQGEALRAEPPQRVPTAIIFEARCDVTEGDATWYVTGTTYLQGGGAQVSSSEEAEMDCPIWLDARGLPEGMPVAAVELFLDPADSVGPVLAGGPRSATFELAVSVFYNGTAPADYSAFA